jgi:hypothetical protein
MLTDLMAANLPKKRKRYFEPDPELRGNYVHAGKLPPNRKPFEAILRSAGNPGPQRCFSESVTR